MYPSRDLEAKDVMIKHNIFGTVIDPFAGVPTLRFDHK